MAQHPHVFTHAGQQWEAQIEDLPQTIEMDLENVIQEGAAIRAEGTAKLMVLREGVKSLYRMNGEKRSPQNLRDSKGNLKLPDARDPETYVGIKEPLLKAVVLFNDFLGHVDPFKGVFESYLPGEEDGGEEEGDAPANPTTQTDTSEGGSVSSLPSHPAQIPSETPGDTAVGS